MTKFKRVDGEIDVTKVAEPVVATSPAAAPVASVFAPLTAPAVSAFGLVPARVIATMSPAPALARTAMAPATIYESQCPFDCSAKKVMFSGVSFFREPGCVDVPVDQIDKPVAVPVVNKKDALSPAPAPAPSSSPASFLAVKMKKARSPFVAVTYSPVATITLDTSPPKESFLCMYWTWKDGGFFNPQLS
jgi:hypothetical protein